jgi:non-ribosomal peptide synthetase component F/acyl carrier protein
MAGAELVIARPGGHSDPGYMVQLIQESGITTLKLVPSLLQMLLTEERFAECAALRQVFCGAEPLSRDLQDRFFALFGERVALHNLYGPTEAAIDATGFTCRPGWDLAGVPIGQPIANATAYVLDRRLKPAPLGVPGELYLGGACLATGYLHAPDLTAERFVPDPFTMDGQESAGGRLYRTGDLVRRLSDGNIEFLGRIDHQVKIRGFRIEPGEIEAALVRHPDVHEAVVLVREDAPGDRRLVAYLTTYRETLQVSELRSFLQSLLPAYMIPSAFVVLPALPLSPSGKIDRKALPSPEARGETEGATDVPRTPIEEGIAAIWCEVLRLDRVGIHDSFFELGGHSLLATRVIARVCDTFQTEVPLKALFETPTVAGIAEQIEALRRSGEGLSTPPLVRVGRDSDLPLSFSQQRLWFVDQLDPGSSLYNIANAVRLRGTLDAVALQRALQEIYRRHEVLRTRYAARNGQPVQTVSSDTDFPLPLRDLTHLSADEREESALRLCRDEAARPFDLAHDPMMRAQLLRLETREHLLLLTLHHIASDGWSSSILSSELSRLYTAFAAGQPSPLAELSIQYADYAAWQRNWLQGERLQRQTDYWVSRLAGAPPVLELPTDRPRETATGYTGAMHRFHLPEGLTERLRLRCREERATPFMVLLAAFNVLLYRWTGQSDLVVGTDVANRTQPQTEELIGFFLNHLVIRTDLSGDPSFRALLGRVREECLGAYAHQDLPFDKLVEVLQPERRTSHTPVFQVLFVVHNVPRGASEMSGLTLERVGTEFGTSKFDLSLFIGESGGAWVYRTDLFDARTVRRLAEQFKGVLEQVLTRPEMAIEDVELAVEPEAPVEQSAVAGGAARPRPRSRRAAVIVEPE